MLNRRSAHARNRLFAVTHDRDLASEPFEKAPRDVLVDRMILNQQYRPVMLRGTMARDQGTASDEAAKKPGRALGSFSKNRAMQSRNSRPRVA